jgi:hypothetical protein
MKKAEGESGCVGPQNGHNVTVVYTNGEVSSITSRPFLGPGDPSSPSTFLYSLGSPSSLQFVIT